MYISPCVSSLATPHSSDFHTSRLFAVMQSLTGASHKFSSIYHGKWALKPILTLFLLKFCPFFPTDTSANPYKNDVNSNLSSTAIMTSPVSKTMMAPLASIQSTLIPSLEGIDLAGRILEWQLKNDNLFPSLADQIKIGEGEDLQSPLPLSCWVNNFAFV